MVHEVLREIASGLLGFVTRTWEKERSDCMLEAVQDFYGRKMFLAAPGYAEDSSYQVSIWY